MIRKILFALAAMCSIMANAQYGVKCNVTDSTGEGEPYATVSIYGAADTTKAVLVNVTNADGVFDQALTHAGKYVLKVSAVGKNASVREFALTAAAPKADLGTIVLGSSANMLKGVEVTAMRQLVKNDIDRLSYDVQADGDSKTNTTLEMLRKVPLVTVDANDNIQVRGSSSFRIYKNGHPDPSLSGSNVSDILKAIPASSIKRIEVITEPGAKYDAEGVTAILNIVMNDNSSMYGVTGTVGVNVDLPGREGANAYITAQAGKLVTTLNYGYGHHGGTHYNKGYGESETYYVQSGNTMTASSMNDNTMDVHFGNINASYEVDSLNLVTLGFGGFYYGGDVTTENRQVMSDAAGTMLYSYKNKAYFPTYNYYNFNGRLDYEHRTSVKDETLTASYMLSTTRSHQVQSNEFSEQINMPVDYEGYDQNTRERFMEHTFQFDWTRPFAKYHKFSLGAKYIYRDNKSRTIMDYYNSTTEGVNSDFKHVTQVAAGYADYIFSKDRWSFRAGVRYEYSYLKASYPDGSASSFHRNLNDVVPSATVGYKINDANSLKLSYSTSINRPGINFLNPAEVSTPTTLSYGNAGLESARINSIGLTYMFVGRRLTLNFNPNYTFSSDGIAGVNSVVDGIVVSTYGNIMTTRMLSFNTYVQWQPFEKTSIMFNGNLQKQYYRNPNAGLTMDRWNMNYFVMLNQQLPWKLRFNVGDGGNLGRQPSDVYGYSKPMNFMFMGLQRSFLKEDRLTVNLSLNMPYRKRMEFTSKVVQGDYLTTSKNSWRARSFGIRISYRFGSLNARVKSTEKTIENNDVVGGVSSGQSSNSQSSQGGGN